MGTSMKSSLCIFFGHTNRKVREFLPELVKEQLIASSCGPAVGARWKVPSSLELAIGAVPVRGVAEKGC